jgi:predicted TIM-barrel fold metal-dependent hydrolase
MHIKTALCTLVLVAFGCAHGPLVPLADHHQHLLSPAAVAIARNRLQPAVALPEELAGLLAARIEHWNDKAFLAGLYTDASIFYEQDGPSWIRGAKTVGNFVGGRFARAYTITPIAFGSDGTKAHVAAYFTREEKAFGQVLFSMEKGADGKWRIAAEAPTFPGPASYTPGKAEELIAKLDDAGIRRAAILSTAYWFGRASDPPGGDEAANTRAENDWTAAEAAKFPDRLVAFFSFNPLKPSALEELERCAKSGRFRGLKLHFANSGVDVRNPEHVEQMRRIFTAANRLHVAIVAHLWVGGDTYGKEDAQIFLEQILPAAPDIPVQIAHFAGGGPGYTDSALGVYADAITAHDPRVKHLYFDVATVADEQSDATLAKFAKRIRQIGLKRVLFGSDLGPPVPRKSWAIFRTSVPLTDAEFGVIASNVAPYFDGVR